MLEEKLTDHLNICKEDICNRLNNSRISVFVYMCERIPSICQSIQDTDNIIIDALEETEGM